VLETFFAGSATDAVAAILHPSVTKLGDDDIERLEELIHQARLKGK
jgi:hypothetical protein